MMGGLYLEKQINTETFTFKEMYIGKTLGTMETLVKPKCGQIYGFQGQKLNND